MSNKQKVFGIIGNPVEHSKSPIMHSYFACITGEDIVYNKYLVESGKLKAMIDRIRNEGISGVNVTAPYKSEVIEYLDEVSEDVRLSMSCNTIVNENGCLKGYTTDAEGLLRSMLSVGVDVKNKDILLFGAGGVSKPVLIEFIKKGANTITLINRTREKAVLLAEDILKLTGFCVDTEIKKEHYDIVVNLTSAGMHPLENVLPFNDLSFIDKETVCVDLIYNPEETLFLKTAKELGAKTLNGKGMLVGQGMVAYELFTGKKLPQEVYEKVIKVIWK